MLKQKKSKLLLTVVMYCVILIFFLPFYIAITYAFKTPMETAQSPLGLPTTLNLSNFIKAIEVSNFYRGLFNSTIVTVVVVVVSVLVCSMAAYIIARRNNKFYNGIFYLFLAAIMLPFQVVMFPLYRQFKELGLLNTHIGLIIALIGFRIGFNTFLITGFVRTVPLDLEEAATIDGCGKYGLFWRITLPLLKPIMMTVTVLSTLGTWNDFVVSMVIAGKKEIQTLPLLQFYFIGEYNQDINMAFAAIILSMIPIFIFYFALQKHIVDGVTAGAVKS